jgi:N-acetylmuramidase
MKAKDWRKVAHYYNGAGQVDEYALRFERAYGAAVSLGLKK